MIIRKLRSALLKFLRNTVSGSTKLRIRFFYDNVSFGENVKLGRMVSIRTTDGGKVVVGDNVCIEDSCLIVAQKGLLSIGNGTYVGHGTHICSIDQVAIGQNCLIAAYCVIRDMQHGMETGLPMADQPQLASLVELEDDVWLGAHAVVTSGVKLGHGCVVAANAVVTKDVDANMIVGGVPAKVLKNRDGART